RVLDGACAVFDGVNGVEPQSETVWHQADRYKVPRICFINKMDRVGADFFMSVRTIIDRLGAHPVCIQLPLGAEDKFEGVIDLVDMQALRFEGEKGERVVAGAIPAELKAEAAGNALQRPLGAESNGEGVMDLVDMQALRFEGEKGERVVAGAIPAELKAQAEEYRHKLLENVAEYDDECLHQYLESHEVKTDALKRAIRKGTIALKCFPVLCGSAFKNKGVQKLLDAVVDYLPSPADVPPVTGKTPDGREGTRGRA